MSDYIKREDAIKIINSGISADTDADKRYVNGLFRAIRPADVAPIRHGRWLECGENKDGTHNIKCSKCGEGFKSKGHANSYYTKHKYRYCPYCGAKMDGDADETD